MPKYMLLIYAPSDAPPMPDDEGPSAPWVEYTESLAEAGELLGGDQLFGLDAATTVRVRGGETQITDGPFAETKEFLGGYYMLDCPDLDRALAHAARCPIMSVGSVEVRPIVDRADGQ
jgi:hypothetical protein